MGPLKKLFGFWLTPAEQCQKYGHLWGPSKSGSRWGPWINTTGARCFTHCERCGARYSFESELK